MKRINVMICIVGITFALTLTGCSMTIPFEKLLDNDRTVQHEDVGEIPKVTQLNLKTDTESKIEEFTKITKILTKKLQDKDLYIKNVTSNYKKTFYSNESIFSKDYIDEMNSREKEDILIELLEDIYRTPNRKVYSTTLVAIGKQVINNKEVYKMVVDVNAVDDDLGFHIQRIDILLNNNKSIINIKKNGEMRNEVNTVNPITKDSEIVTSVHDKFIAEFKNLINSISNKPLYEKLIREGKNGESSEFKSFVTKIDLKDKEISSLYDMFKAGKGEFKNYAITSYEHKDINADAITNYTITIPYEGGISSFNIDFNRISNKIIGIKKIK